MADGVMGTNDGLLGAWVQPSWDKCSSKPGTCVCSLSVQCVSWAFLTCPARCGSVNKALETMERWGQGKTPKRVLEMKSPHSFKAILLTILPGRLLFAKSVKTPFLCPSVCNHSLNFISVFPVKSADNQV